MKDVLTNLWAVWLGYSVMDIGGVHWNTWQFAAIVVPTCLLVVVMRIVDERTKPLP